MSVELMQLRLGEEKSGITLKSITSTERIDPLVCLITRGMERHFRKGGTFLLSDVSYSIARIQEELVTLSYYSLANNRGQQNAAENPNVERWLKAKLGK